MQRDNNEENVRPPVAAFDDILIGGPDDITEEEICIMARQAHIQEQNGEALEAALLASLGNQSAQSAQSAQTNRTQHEGQESKILREVTRSNEDAEFDAILESIKIIEAHEKAECDAILESIKMAEDLEARANSPVSIIFSGASSMVQPRRSEATSSTSFAAAPTPGVERKGESEAARIAREKRAAAVEKLAKAAKTKAVGNESSSNSAASSVGTQASTSTTTTGTTTAMAAIPKAPKK